jgi:hypothetical protein
MQTIELELPGGGIIELEFDEGIAMRPAARGVKRISPEAFAEGIDKVLEFAKMIENKIGSSAQNVDSFQLTFGIAFNAAATPVVVSIGGSASLSATLTWNR